MKTSNSNSNDKNRIDESVSRTRGLKVDTSSHDRDKTTSPLESSFTDVMNWPNSSLIQHSLEPLTLGDGEDSGAGDDKGCDEEEEEEEEVEAEAEEAEAEAGVADETPRARPLKDIANGFSPEDRRVWRIKNKGFKVQTFGHSPTVCGGDYICNHHDQLMTLAFAWEGSGEYEGKRFGLTCAHLLEDKYWSGLGRPELRDIYLVNSNITNYEHTDLGKMLIGRAQFFNRRTDSMIIEFLPQIKVKLNKIRVNPKEELDINLSDIMLETSRLVENVEVLAFGGTTRGAIGHVNSARPRRNREALEINSFCAGVWSSKENEEPGSSLLSREGDCGMIYINRDRIPVGMHHGASRRGQAYISWILPLDQIIQVHSELFGIDLPPDDANDRPTVWQVRTLNKTSWGKVLPREEEDDDEDDDDAIDEIVLSGSLYISDMKGKVEVDYGCDDDDEEEGLN